MLANGLRYTHWDGAAWQLQTIEDLISAISSRDSSLVLDSAGNPHLLYAETQADTLEYARWDGAQWQIETAAGSAYYSALALDSSGQARVAYYDLLAYDLIYGWREP